VAAISREYGPPALRPDEVPDGQRFNATGGGPLHGPVSLPHIPVRTDDTPRKAVYLIIHAGMANARVPPLAPSRNGSPGPSSPPTLAGAFHFNGDDRSSIVEGVVGQPASLEAPTTAVPLL
jgi:hypothetical protein